MTYRRFLLGLSINALALLAMITPISHAAENCTVVYGGGEIACRQTPTPTKPGERTTPTKAVKATVTKTPTPTPKQTTKGGLPVHPPTQTKTTPPTGAEALFLVPLLSAAAAGWYLKKKVK